MAAMYRVNYTTTDLPGHSQSLIIYAADAKNMTQKAMREATRNATRRAKKRIASKLPKGIKVAISNCACIG